MSVTVDTYTISSSRNVTVSTTVCSGTSFGFTAPAPNAYAPVWSVNGLIGAVEVTPSNIPGWTQGVQQSLAASLQAQWGGATGAVVVAGTIYFAFKAPYAGTINSLDFFTGQGSFVVSIAIGGTAVAGLSNVAVNSPTPTTLPALGANVFAQGQSITGIITSVAGTPTDALLNLNVNWS